MRMSSGSAKTASRFRATSTTRWPSARSSDSQSSSPTAQSAVSSPKLFEQYRLEGRKGCDRIEPRLVAADPLAQFRVSAANVEASSWSGITPAERRFAFRSQRMSNSNSSTPITSCSRCSGTRSTNGPSAATMSASAARPAVEPSPPRRQPRTVAEASTIVRASRTRPASPGTTPSRLAKSMPNCLSCKFSKSDR